MTIASTINRNNYIGNGAVDTYNYSFRIFSQEDLKVTVRNIASGVETLLVIGTDYTVTGVGELAGGTVALVDNNQAWLDAEGDLDTTYAISIRRVLEMVQETDIRNQGDFYPEAHEDALDILTMLDQQQQDELDRSIKLAETIDPDDFDAALPAEFVGSVNTVLMTNDTGDGWKVGPTANQISGASASATAAAASAAAALASQIAAAASEAAAASSETNAAASEAAAAASQAAAATSESNADSSETAAAASAAAAAASATAASASATAAGTSATNASNSATAAATSATNASNSATAAATSATNAATSETNAAASAASLNPSLVATESVANGAAVTTNNNLMQNRKVQGNGGAVTAATLAFGSSTSVDGITMRLIGQSDVNTLGLTYSDVNYGLLLNGDCVLGKGDVITFLFDLTALRWYEISRNF